MKNLNFNILKDLCNIYSPSGYENDIIKYIESAIKKSTKLNYKITKKNSLVAYSKVYNEKAETIMFDAHIDQVHLKVLKIMDDGIIIALPVGFDSVVTDGLTLVHLKSLKSGVVNTNPPHLNIDRRNTNEVYIDFGMSYNEAKKIIRVGDYIMFKSNFELIGKENISGTGLDNKVSIFILLEIIAKLDAKVNYNLIFHFSSREEIGLGSISLLFNSLDIPIVKKINEILTIDTIFITDSEIIPESDTYTSDIFPNEGPVITRNADDDVCLTEAFILLSDEYKLPLQLAYTGEDNGGSNNSDYSKYTDAYTQMIGIPLKHMHSPTELVTKFDISTTLNLLNKYIRWK